MAEAYYLLLSKDLTVRVLSAPDLECAAHAGLSAGYWFTKGNALNDFGDVEWVNDPRLDHHGSFLSGHGHRYADACMTHMGVHQAYPDSIAEVWEAAKETPGPISGKALRDGGSLLQYVDDGRCEHVDQGVKENIFRRDNGQPCKGFVTKDVSIHCGVGGC